MRLVYDFVLGDWGGGGMLSCGCFWVFWFIRFISSFVCLLLDLSWIKVVFLVFVVTVGVNGD